MNFRQCAIQGELCLEFSSAYLELIVPTSLSAIAYSLQFRPSVYQELIAQNIISANWELKVEVYGL